MVEMTELYNIAMEQQSRHISIHINKWREISLEADY